MNRYFDIIFTIKFILMWMFMFYSSVFAVNLNTVDTSKTKHASLIVPNLISDNAVNTLLSENLTSFVFYYNKYTNVVSFQSSEKQNLVKINHSLHNLDILKIQTLLINSSLSVSQLREVGDIKNLKKKDVLTQIKFNVQNCIKGNICNNIDSKVPVVIPLSNIAKVLNKNRIYLQSTNPTNSYLELVVFTNSDNINEMFENKDVAYTISFSESVFDNWISIINSNDSLNLERELLQFHEALNNPCLIKLSPYCLINNNEESKLINFIIAQKKLDIPSIKLYLLIDFAIKTENEKMVIFLYQQNLKSIHFTTKRDKLYAASANNLVKSVAVILDDNDINIDYLYDTGLTPLGVAIGKNSLDVVSLLIDKGAITIGNLLDKRYSGYPPKILNKENYYLFELLSTKYAIKDRNIPELLNIIILRHISDGEQQLNWLNKMLKEKYNLYKNLFLQNVEFSRRVLIESSKLKNSNIFDFFINHGVNLCLAFDNEAMKSIDDRRVKDESLWLNARYKDYLAQCENSIGN